MVVLSIIVSAQITTARSERNLPSAPSGRGTAAPCHLSGVPRDVTQLTSWSLPSGQDLSAIYTDTPSKNSSLFSSVCLETISRGVPHANTGFRTCQIMLSSFQASASSLQPSLLTSSLSLPLSFLLHSFRGSLPSWSREQALEPDDQDQNPSSCRLQAV